MRIAIGLGWLLLLACILSSSCEAGIDWRLSFVPLDPWRTTNGQTNYVKLNGVQFCGRIVDVTPHGIRMEGEWGELGTIYFPKNGWSFLPEPPHYPEFFVTNYPYRAAVGGIIPSATRLMAWVSGAYTYQTARGGPRTIRELDYGTPCGPNPVLLAAMQKQLQEAEALRREKEKRRIEILQKDAARGDSSAQYSLGVHYLHGLGCETNQVMGIFWLLKAQEQGNMEASNELQEIQLESANPQTLKH
ncbi:MAG TPA: hypothetical protein VGY98_02115 [Verrucomicrobiae bacterium]|nr:hypothetical protein [Verrucomicrobiae bacterium]